MTSLRSNPTCPTLVTLALLLLPMVQASGQQVADTAFMPPIPEASLPAGGSPQICVDHGHFNFHRMDGRYSPFALLLGRAGYTVRPHEGPLTKSALATCRVLVTANALAERNSIEDWSLPTPSAFTTDEILAVVEWVEGGGSLFLIADHMPFAGAATELGAAFGVAFSNGFTVYPELEESQIIFRKSDGSVREDPATMVGRLTAGADSILGGIGSAFKAPDLEPVLVWREGAISREPETAWEFPEGTPERDIQGWLQGAVGKWGEGRLAIFGEGSSFTAQVQGPERMPMGMNNPLAGGNVRFLLNLMLWLAEGE